MKRHEFTGLHFAMEAKGLTDVALGQATGIHPKTIAKYRKGILRFRKEIAEQASQVLGYSPEQLMFWDQHQGRRTGALVPQLTGGIDTTDQNRETSAKMLDKFDLSTGDAALRPRPMEPEGEKIDPQLLADELARPLREAISGRNAEIWRLTTDNLAGRGYQRGDYCVVDLSQAPLAGNVVLAETHGRPLFRLYHPPYLLALPIGHYVREIVEENGITIVRGVVLWKFTLG